MESGDSIQPSPDEALTELDLDAIETDLADVEVALARLEAGTYWTCEVTGQALDDELLELHPTARRRPGV
jgi:RNA polymerase-binding transcription factor DksA